MRGGEENDREKHCPLEFHDVLLPNAFLPGIFHGQAPLPVFGRACNMRLNNAHAPSARELWRDVYKRQATELSILMYVLSKVWEVLVFLIIWQRLIPAFQYILWYYVLLYANPYNFISSERPIKIRSYRENCFKQRGG